MDIIERSKQYAIECHSSTNHQYDGSSYSVHLQMVFNCAMKFIHLIPAESQKDVLAACWVHDVIEDCRQTYNDVKGRANEAVAELAYALTNEKGKTRKERANDKYYEGIRKTPFAAFVKACDRMANYEYSKQNGSRMAIMYADEMGDFVHSIYDPKYDEVFNYLFDSTIKS